MSAEGRALGEADLLAYVDDELDETRRAEVEAALARDASLAAQAERWRRQDELVRAAFARVAAEPLPAALAGRGRDPRPALPAGNSGGSGGGAEPLRVTPVDRDRVLRLRRQRQARIMAATLVAFLSGALVMFVASRLLDRGQPVLVATGGLTAPVVPDAARRLGLRALETHFAFTRRDGAPLDVTAQEPVRLATLVQGLVGGADGSARTTAPDLSSQGLRLAGARVAVGEQAPALWLLYEGAAGEKVSLFATRLVSAESPPRYDEEPRAGTIFWTNTQFGFAIAGPREKERLARLAAEVRAQVPQAR